MRIYFLILKGSHKTLINPNYAYVQLFRNAFIVSVTVQRNCFLAKLSIQSILIVQIYIKHACYFKYENKYI